MVLKLPPRGIEGIPDRDTQILMGVVLGRIAAHNDFTFRHNQFNADVVQPALTMVTVACFHDHAAGDDPIEEALEFGDTLANLVLNSDGRIHVAESDAKRLLHAGLLYRFLAGWAGQPPGALTSINRSASPYLPVSTVNISFARVNASEKWPSPSSMCRCAGSAA
jgi:hypothetical protein